MNISSSHKVWLSKRSESEFGKLLYQSRDPKPGFDVWVALWNNGGNGQAMIGAPTLEALADRWLQITGTELERERAQHVIVIPSDVPESMFQQAKRIVRGEESPPSSDTSSGESPK